MKSDDDGVPAEVFRFSGGGVLALKDDAYHPPTRNEDASKFEMLKTISGVLMTFIKMFFYISWRN